MSILRNFKSTFFKEHFERLLKFHVVMQKFNVGLQFYIQSLQEQKEILKQTTMKWPPMKKMQQNVLQNPNEKEWKHDVFWICLVLRC